MNGKLRIFGEGEVKKLWQNLKVQREVFDMKPTGETRRFERTTELKRNHDNK